VLLLPAQSSQLHVRRQKFKLLTKATSKVEFR